MARGVRPLTGFFGVGGRDFESHDSAPLSTDLTYDLSDLHIDDVGELARCLGHTDDFVTDF